MAKPSGRRTSQFQLKQGQPQPSVPSLENNFVAGLKTEYTGLNFPENACAATQNCTFTRVGNVTRRNGFDYESGFTSTVINRINAAISTFLWENAGGDGNTIVEVSQVGGTLYFYQASNATNTKPLSTTLLPSTVDITAFTATGGTFDPTVECQYSTGNGYLFVYQPTIDPFYCTFSGGVISANMITIKQRDFVGIVEPGVDDNFRPFTLSSEHQYNIQNQGWTSAALWQAQTITPNTPHTVPLGLVSFTVQTGITGISAGQNVSIQGVHPTGSPNGAVASGVVTSYVSGTGILTINVNSTNNQPLGSADFWKITPVNAGLITTWHTAEGSYPSNADVWWTFKNSSGVFDPATTAANITLGTGPAPKGFYIINAFDQERSSISGLSGITPVVTTTRPKTGAFFAGRVWYAGVDASFPPTGDEPFSTWTENIYFSQIITSTAQFGRCYQTNDPTSETLFDILPTDGGVITIQGSGSIYKLFPVLNGILVFAANGIWFISGSQGIGFTATDYSVSKLSGEHAISGTSFVNVTGYPIFWNADGIYAVMPGQSYTSGQKGLEVKNLTLSTIKQFYQSIPLSSKKNARGSYNHLTGVIQWLYKSTEAVSTTDAYSFDSILNFLTYTEAFYPWTLPNGASPVIHSITYIEGPGGLNVSMPTFKYLTSLASAGSYNFTFSEERDNVHWEDWFTAPVTTVDYTSSFTTGYKLKGQGQRKFQPQYIYVYSEIPIYGYTFQGIWDYALTNISNRFSTIQVVNSNKPLYAKAFRKHRIRGDGYVLQLKLSSVTGQPFSISGWSVIDTIGIG